MMKKVNKYLFVFIFFVLSFICINNVKASYKATVISPSSAKCDVYSKTHPDSSNRGYCFYKDSNLNSIVDKVFFLDPNDTVTVLEDEGTVPTKDTSLCKDYYVYVTYTFPTDPLVSYKGLYCSTYLKKIEVDEDIKNNLRVAGFPESYLEGLAILKESHPKWTFLPIQTNLDWNDVINAESAVGVSFIQGDEGYRSTLGGSYDYYNDKFKVMEGTSWYAANSQVIAYYMDPRNFFSNTYIFQFETLKYVPSVHTLEAVQTLLKENYLSKYSESFIEAAETSKVSSLYLAALALQEVGGNEKGTAVSGEPFIYNPSNSKHPTLRGLEIEGGYYNVYNIGAGTDVSPAQNSVIYAMGGVDKSATTYDRPWKSMESAIIGGAKFTAAEYVAVGQDTVYFKKFNVTPVGGNLYSHQYQTNIIAATSEGNKMYKAYAEQDKLDQEFVFAIPIYNNMPEVTTMPNKGNPNNYLKELKIKIGDNSLEQSVNDFDGAKTDYTLYVGYSNASVTIVANPVNSKAKISNIGLKNLNVGDNKFNIIVTAENGDTKTYNLNIIRSQNETGEPTVDEIVEKLGVKSDGTYFSGIVLDVEMTTLTNKVKSINANAGITIKNSSYKASDTKTFATNDTVTITSAGETKTFTVVIYGDTNGDAKINPLDLLRIQKHILNITKLSGAEFKAADISKNGNVDPLDLLRVQKHILGASSIEQ